MRGSMAAFPLFFCCALGGRPVHTLAVGAEKQMAVNTLQGACYESAA